MPTGTVKWFNNAKGFGFILPDDGGEDLFAHYSSIEMDGYKTLKAGQTVSYELSDTDKGGHAKNISIVLNDQHSDQTPQQSPAAKESSTAIQSDPQREATPA